MTKAKKYRSTASAEQLARTARALEALEAHPRKRKFVVHLLVEVEVDQSLFDAVLTDEWRKMFYAFFTPADVAGNLAYCLVQGMPLSSLDGYADQDEKSVHLGPLDIDHVEEIEEEAKPTRHPKKVANARRSKRR